MKVRPGQGQSAINLGKLSFEPALTTFLKGLPSESNKKEKNESGERRKRTKMVVDGKLRTTTERSFLHSCRRVVKDKIM